MSNVGFATLQVIPSFSGAQAALTTGMTGPAQSAGATAGAGFGSKFAGALKAAAPVAVVAGIGAGLLKLGSTFQQSFKTIRVSTGATGDALDGLERSFKNVAKSRPDSFDDVSTAISKLNVGLGLTGPNLESLSTQVLRLSGITKTDLGTNLDAVTTLMNGFGIEAKDQGGRLDELFRASQATGVSVADLASNMAGAAPLFKTAGLSFEQSASILGLLGKAGISTSSIMAPLSKAITTAAKSGKSAKDVFSDTFKAIKDAPTATEAAGRAVEVFGARAGPKLAGLIRAGKLSYADLAKTISSGTDTIEQAAKDTGTISGKFKTFRNSIAVALEPIATGLFDAVNHAAGVVLPIAARGVAKFADLVAAVARSVTGWVSKLAGPFDFAKRLAQDFILTFQDPDITSDGIFGVIERGASNLRGIFDAVIGVLGRFVDRVKIGWQQITAAFKFGLDDFALGDNKLDDFFLRIGGGAKAAVDFITGTVIPGLKQALGSLLAGFRGQGVGQGSFFADLGNAARKLVDFVQGEVLPIMRTAADRLLSVLRRVGDFVKSNLKPILIGLGITIAAIAAPVLTATAAFIYLYQKFPAVRAAVAAVVGAVQTAVSFFATSVVPVIASVVAGVLGFFTNLVAGVQERWGAISEAIGHVVNVIKVLLIGTLGPIILAAILFWREFGDDIVAIVRAAFGLVIERVKTAVRIVRDVIDFVLAIINGDWGKAWHSLLDVFSAVWDAIADTVKFALAVVKTLFGAGLELVVDVVKGALNGIVGFFEKLPGRLGKIGAGIFDFLKTAFKGAINFIIDGWNSLKFKLPSFDGWKVAGKTIIPAFTGPTLGVPPIKRLHSGGLFTTLAGADEGLAMLQNGERVLSRADTAAFDRGQLGRRGDTHFHVTQLPGEDVVSAAMRADRWQRTIEDREAVFA